MKKSSKRKLIIAAIVSLSVLMGSTVIFMLVYILKYKRSREASPQKTLKTKDPTDEPPSKYLRRSSRRIDKKKLAEEFRRLGEQNLKTVDHIESKERPKEKIEDMLTDCKTDADFGQELSQVEEFTETDSSDVEDSELLDKSPPEITTENPFPTKIDSFKETPAPLDKSKKQQDHILLINTVKRNIIASFGPELDTAVESILKLRFKIAKVARNDEFLTRGWKHIPPQLDIILSFPEHLKSLKASKILPFSKKYAKMATQDYEQLKVGVDGFNKMKHELVSPLSNFFDQVKNIKNHTKHTSAILPLLDRFKSKTENLTARIEKNLDYALYEIRRIESLGGLHLFNQGPKEIKDFIDKFYDKDEPEKMFDSTGICIFEKYAEWWKLSNIIDAGIVKDSLKTAEDYLKTKEDFIKVTQDLFDLSGFDKNTMLKIHIVLDLKIEAILSKLGTSLSDYQGIEWKLTKLTNSLDEELDIFTKGTGVIRQIESYRKTDEKLPKGAEKIGAFLFATEIIKRPLLEIESKVKTSKVHIEKAINIIIVEEDPIVKRNRSYDEFLQVYQLMNKVKHEMIIYKENEPETIKETLQKLSKQHHRLQILSNILSDSNSEFNAIKNSTSVVYALKNPIIVHIDKILRTGKITLGPETGSEIEKKHQKNCQNQEIFCRARRTQKGT